MLDQSGSVRRLPPPDAAAYKGDWQTTDYDPSVQPAGHLAPLAAATMVLGNSDIAAPVITGFTKTDGNPVNKENRREAVWYHNETSATIYGTVGTGFKPAEHRVGLYQLGSTSPTEVIAPTATKWQYTLTNLSKGPNTFVARVVSEDTHARVDEQHSNRATIEINTVPPSVAAVDDNSLIFAQGPDRIRVVFDTKKLDGYGQTAAYNIVAKTSGVSKPSAWTVEKQEESAAAVLTVEGMAPALYELTINANNTIVDWHGNRLPQVKREIYKPVEGRVPSIRPGITGHTGPYVEYPEFTAPRKVPDGFNPSDHVETRVARLYYYRDAHRVAQIINRTVKSYNRTAVDIQRQLADKARNDADTATTARQNAERAAIIAAQKTRQKEHELASAEQWLSQVLSDLSKATPSAKNEEGESGAGSEGEGESKEGASTEESEEVSALRNAARSLSARVNRLRQEVQNLREEEVQKNELAQQLDRQERLAREEQFRREVAAAHADPDTYAPGVPGSDDPVRQVSVSVIGEGLIQLRGPLKGINIIRRMINQIDAPVGQVRVNVHTVQINGEHGNRMEQVANKIQKHIDHSRFLTVQSAEILRRAIVKVASRRAMEAMDPEARGSQEVRDQRYLYAFFGRDFIDELRAMDSEFLQTGNKLLSLHSMDTTSLSSALFLMALANNSTRQEIISEFQEMLASELPVAEESYYEAGSYATRRWTREGWQCKDKFQLFSQNARFESLRGFFDGQCDIDNNTMTPIQREFIRLAQIFKGRLITEMELKQRIMERAVIEQRVGDYRKQLQDARTKEERARAELVRVEGGRRTLTIDLVALARDISAQVRSILDDHRKARTQSNDLHEKVEKAVTEGITRAILGAFLEKVFLGDRRLAALAAKDVHEAIEHVKQRHPEYSPLIEELAAKISDSVLVPSAEKHLGKRIIDFQKTWAEAAVNFLEPKIGKEAADHLRKEFAKQKPVPVLVNIQLRTRSIEFKIDDQGKLVISPDDLGALQHELTSVLRVAEEANKGLLQFKYAEPYRSDLKAAQDALQEAMRKATSDGKKGGEKAAELIDTIFRLSESREYSDSVAEHTEEVAGRLLTQFDTVIADLTESAPDVQRAYRQWTVIHEHALRSTEPDSRLGQLIRSKFPPFNDKFLELLKEDTSYQFAQRTAEKSRRPLDHKKFLDMLVDDLEEKYIELLEGTRAHTANIDNYIKRLATALENDFNTQFYHPSFRGVRDASRYWDVTFGQIETTGILANNRSFAKVEPHATMEFDLPKRDILINEAMNGAKAMMDDFGALVNDPSFLSLAAMGSGQPTSSPGAGSMGGFGSVRSVVPGLDSSTAEELIAQGGPGRQQFGSAMEALIPDPAIYKFETGTGFEIRPVIQPDGQAVVFHFNYMYTTNVREPVRADEKHLGRIKRHFIDTDVQLSNYELREVSRYQVALKASRTSRGVPLLEDIPIAGVLFRPLPQQESSLQQNLILAQATIYPTLFDLMGLRWAPAVADLDPLRLSNAEFVVRSRRRALMNRVYDHASSQVDQFLRIPEANRRPDLYRTQETIPALHPNGYQGPGLDYRDSTLQEGYQPKRTYPQQQFVPSESAEGALVRPGRKGPRLSPQIKSEKVPVEIVPPPEPEVAPLP
ncbi:MAG: coiled-coil domain-containing protein [Planctomycetota bacterium]|jgi:hypothetical protein